MNRPNGCVHVFLALVGLIIGSYRQVYEHEAAWAEVMFNEWGADGVKVDHMCQGANCGTGAQGHMMAVEFQQVRHPHLTLT